MINKTLFFGIIISFFIGFIFCKFYFSVRDTIEISKLKNDLVINILRGSARYSIASEQDLNPMIKILHANYGAGYLWALKDALSDSEIEKISGIDIIKFKNAIIKNQDTATKEMIKVCPKFAPPYSYLGSVAGEGL